MSYRLPRYRVSLVREGSCTTDQNAIRSPEDVFAVMNAEYENAAVETVGCVSISVTIIRLRLERGGWQSVDGSIDGQNWKRRMD